MARGRCFAASSSRRVMRSASVRALCHASSSREYLQYKGGCASVRTTRTLEGFSEGYS